MARRTRAPDHSAPRPWTDEDDLSDWEITGSDATARITHSVTVRLRPEHLRYIVAAAENEGLDLVQYIQTKADELGESLRQLDAPLAHNSSR